MGNVHGLFEGSLAGMLWMFAVFAMLLVFVSRLLRLSIDPKEPPRIAPQVPFLGHVLGLLCHGVPYYSKVHAGRSLPIYTLDLYITKMYVVNSANLVSAVQRNHKLISFDPFLTAAANRLAGVTGSGLKLLQEEQAGGGGVHNRVLEAMRPALRGPGLDVMNRNMISGLCASVDRLAGTAGLPVDLNTWCRRGITIASTESVWGPLNPLRSEELQHDFWEFESNLGLLLLNICPRYTARTAFRARERVVAAFVDYYEAGGQHNSSELAFVRWKTQHDAGATCEDIARLEASTCIGLLSNTVPTTFWMLLEVYSRAELLARIRDEIRQNGVCVDAVTGVHSVSLTRLRDSCPVLVSAYQEVLRVHSNGTATRVVYDDVLLNDEYLLKRGAVVQMPAAELNHEPSNWGADARDFDALRFIKTEKREKVRATSYLSFGASPHICPGRHFASGEILSLVAIMVLRYDVTPVGGKWWTPALNSKALAASVTPPAEAYPVLISNRAEYEGTAWKLTVEKGRGQFGLVTG